MLEDPSARPEEALVDKAEAALRDWGGDPTPGVGSTLVRHWHRAHLLTLDDLTEVIRRFRAGMAMSTRPASVAPPHHQAVPGYDATRLLADILCLLSEAGIPVTVGAPEGTAAGWGLLDVLGVGEPRSSEVPASHDGQRDPRATPTHAAAGAAAHTAEPPGVEPAFPPGASAAAPAATPGGRP